MDLQFGNSNEMAQENEVFRTAHTDLDWMRILSCLESPILRTSPTKMADFLKLDIGFVMSTIERMVEGKIVRYAETGFEIVEAFLNKSPDLALDFSARQKAILFNSQINRYMSEETRKAAYGNYVYLMDAEEAAKLQSEINAVFTKYIFKKPTENSVLVGGTYSLVRLSSGQVGATNA